MTQHDYNSSASRNKICTIVFWQNITDGRRKRLVCAGGRFPKPLQTVVKVTTQIHKNCRIKSFLHF